MEYSVERCAEGWWFNLLSCAALLSLATLGVGCGKGVKVAEMGESAKSGGIEFSVGDYQIRNLEIVEKGKTHEYKKPVLAIPVTLKNVGKDGFRYGPTHEAQQMTESTTPLLYFDPGKDAKLPPDDKSPINGVYLEEGRLEEQVTEDTTIKPGKSVKDVLLFEIPSEKEEKLILSLPPVFHRGSKPVLFRIPFKYEEPKGEKTRGVGDAANVDGVKFKVTGVSTEYIALADTRDGKAYSSSPLLKVSYEVKNTTDKKIEYSPKHQDDSVHRTPILKSKDDTFRPVEFPLNPTITGQVDGLKEIKPGKKVQDFSVFQRPGKSVKALTFKFPASRFNRGGLLEFKLPYEYKEPDKPDELKGDEEE